MTPAQGRRKDFPVAADRHPGNVVRHKPTHGAATPTAGRKNVPGRRDHGGGETGGLGGRPAVAARVYAVAGWGRQPCWPPA